MGRIAALGVLALAALGTVLARAHTSSEMFLTLTVSTTNVSGQWDVSVRDLQQGLKVAPERWQTFSATERQRWLEALAVDTANRLAVKADGRPLALRVTDLEAVTLPAGEYERVTLSAPVEGPPVSAIEINARALFSVDPNTHGLLHVEHGERTEAASFDAEHPARIFALAQPGVRLAQVWTFVREGVRHIWGGPDHVLFLLALLLPAVLSREGSTWTQTDAWRPAVVRVLKIVTAFTLAHSITLSLAVLDIVRMPARIVEPLIAASVIAAAVNNLWPWFGGRGWLVAFGFGLVHGFGFASGLLEFGLRRETFAVALVGFNLGVELGQVAIVIVFLPVAFLLCGSWFYRTVAFKYGSAAVALVAAVWMSERLFDFKLLPF